eukprot:Seg1155.1 transcript_id=Seg1155.1/GoldUCD/mRNA.D3Y31 product="hypothetical protein" protein_id=Seg1155.1/GoldUCD/D3Y31
MPWNEIDSIDCIDEAATHWESLFNRVADKHAPIKKQRVKGFKTPWVTNEVLQLRRERNYHQTKGRKIRSQYHWQMYRKLRNHINRLEKRLKSEHFCRMIEENKNDSSRMWKCLKDALPQPANHSVSVIKSGKKVLSKPVQVAKVFNKHFTTIGQKIAKAFGKWNKDARGLLQKKTDETNFVKIQLQNLKTNKAIGLDKISARLLKDSADIIAPSLQALINKSFLEGKFPNNWKLAKVVALFKSGYKRKNCNEIQNKMNEDLALVKKWLNDHRLTLNITKSKFVVVGGKQQLKHFQDLTLKIEEDELSRESSY